MLHYQGLDNGQVTVLGSHKDRSSVVVIQTRWITSMLFDEALDEVKVTPLRSMM